MDKVSIYFSTFPARLIKEIILEKTGEVILQKKIKGAWLTTYKATRGAHDFLTILRGIKRELNDYLKQLGNNVSKTNSNLLNLLSSKEFKYFDLYEEFKFLEGNSLIQEIVKEDTLTLDSKKRIQYQVKDLLKDLIKRGRALENKRDNDEYKKSLAHYQKEVPILLKEIEENPATKKSIYFLKVSEQLVTTYTLKKNGLTIFYGTKLNNIWHGPIYKAFDSKVTMLNGEVSTLAKSNGVSRAHFEMLRSEPGCARFLNRLEKSLKELKKDIAIFKFIKSTKFKLFESYEKLKFLEENNLIEEIVNLNVILDLDVEINNLLKVINSKRNN